MKIEGNVIIAEDGMAIHRIGSPSPTQITRAALSANDSTDNWEDCDYGEEPTDEATEADKDAALTTLGVDMTEG